MTYASALCYDYTVTDREPSIYEFVKENISPLPRFEPKTSHGSQYEADGIPIGHHASVVSLSYMERFFASPFHNGHPQK